MRSISLTLVSLITCFGVGCSFLNKSKDAPPKAATGEIPERSAKDLVDYLNRQSALVQSISYTDVSVTASENGKDMPRLGDSTLVAQKPKNFRLVCGTLATSGEVDLGSNDREFWMYVKRMDGPNYFYCTHDDFNRGVSKKFPIPFDTDWVMQALGLSSYPAEGFEATINKQHRKYILTQNTTTPAGQPVRRLIAFNVDHEGGKKPVVWKHLIADANNQTLASAEILSTKTVAVSGQFVQVPSEVVLEWPQQKFRMKLVLDGERVNEDIRDRQAMLFTRPQIRGANPIDLATYTFEPTARGAMPDRTRNYRVR